MDNLIFCLNVTVPIFLTLLLGYFFRRIGLFDEAFVNRMNKFVFVIPLPVLLFQDIAKIDIYEAWDSKMVIFCFLITSVSIIISVLLSRLLHPSDIRGEFIQASYRSSAAILGIAVIQNLYGNAGMAPLMIIASVPLYNVMAVVVLSVFKAGWNCSEAYFKRHCHQSHHSRYCCRYTLVSSSPSLSEDPGLYRRQSCQNCYSSWSHGHGWISSFWESFFQAQSIRRLYLYETDRL